MKIALISLLSMVLVSPIIAQNNECKDLSCLVYLLATDPLQPEVAEYINKHDGWTFKENGPAIDNPAFVYFTSQINKNRNEKEKDDRQLVTSLRVDGDDAINEVLLTLGYPKDYESLRVKNPAKYAKVKKKYSVMKVTIGYDAALTAEKGSFSDYWSGSIQYRRNAEGELMASAINLALIESQKDKAISYNPVGWHTTNLKAICETGDCTVCNAGRLGSIRGVTVEKQDGFRDDLITIDVQNTDLELPLGLEYSVSYQELMFLYGPDHPWEMEEGVFSLSTSKEPIKFYFEDDVLVKIVATAVGCDLNYNPIPFTVRKTKVLGGATADSPVHMDYSGGFTYIGEMKNNIPHGIGTLITKEGVRWSGDMKNIFGNKFENGKPIGNVELEKPICIGSNCDKNGEVITKWGLYKGDLKDGLPHGSGTLWYTYSSTVDKFKGRFKDGAGVSDKGTIEYHDKTYYIGEIAGSLPHGNGKIYNQYGVEVEDGWYQGGTRVGGYRGNQVEVVAHNYKFDPKKGSLQGYIAAGLAEFKNVQQSKFYAESGRIFGFWARSCGNTINKANVLNDCIYMNHSKHTDGEYKVSSTIKEMWTEIVIAIDSPVCSKGETWAFDVLEETKRLFKQYRSSVENLSPYYKAATAQLSTTEAQRDGKLAKTLFSNIVSGIATSYSSVDRNFSDFVNSFAELEKIMKGNDCY